MYKYSIVIIVLYMKYYVDTLIFNNILGEKGIWKMEEKIKKYGKQELSKRISRKYNGYTYESVSTFIDILCEEMFSIIAEEKQELLIPKICNIKISKRQKYGYDFKNSKRICNGEMYKITIKPHSFLKETVVELNKNLEEKE